MIEVAVGQQEPPKPPESGAAPKQLPLGSLSAIDEHALAANYDEQTRMIAFRRWNAGRRAEESQVKHLGTLVLGTGRLGPLGTDIRRRVGSINSQPTLTSSDSPSLHARG
jgi:hypothetical protein